MLERDEAYLGYVRHGRSALHHVLVDLLTRSISRGRWLRGYRR